jgi:hypothetical protein
MNKQTKILLGIVSIVIALGLLLFIVEPDAKAPTDNTTSFTNVLSVDKPMHDFGTISMKDGKVKTSFLITNNQTSEFSLNKLYTSCMCTEATLKINDVKEGPFGMPGHGALPTFSEKLQSNQQAELEVEFDPNAHGPSGIGVIERTVVLESRDGKLVEVGIKANVRP